MQFPSPIFTNMFLVPLCNVTDTHRENALSNKSQTLTKFVNMDIWIVGILNMDIWVVGILNKLFTKGSDTILIFFKK